MLKLMEHPFHLVIPCLNESGRLGPFLEELTSVFQGHPIASIQVVDDGSGPDEQRMVEGILAPLRQRYSFVLPLQILPLNLGKGGAVREGWKKHGGAAWLAFADADGSCRPAEILRLMKSVLGAGEKRKAWFACRVRMLGRSIRRDWHRHAIGRVYATLVSLLLDIPVYDSQCGLKIVGRGIYEDIEPLLKIQGFAFDIELLAALWDSAVPVEEVPIDWQEKAGGKVRLVRDSWRMFKDTVEVRKRRSDLAWLHLTQTLRPFPADPMQDNVLRIPPPSKPNA